MFLYFMKKGIARGPGKWTGLESAGGTRGWWQIKEGERDYEIRMDVQCFPFSSSDVHFIS